MTELTYKIQARFEKGVVGDRADGTQCRAESAPPSEGLMTSRHRSRWSDTDKQMLVFLWDGHGPEEIGAKLGRTRGAIENKAVELKLSVKQGLSTMTEAAAKAGVDRDVIRRLIGKGKLQARRGPKSESKKRFHRYVNNDAMVEAIESYLGGETCLAAARRYGHPDEWMKRRLIAAGVYRQSYAHRYPTEVIDKAVASYVTEGPRKVVVGDEALTMREWSARTGVRARLIAERLRDGWSPERAVSVGSRRHAT